MSSLDTNAVIQWNAISDQVNRYFSIFIFIFGTIGNLLNIAILSQPTLRLNPCSLYFLISSAANLVAILSGLTTRMLSGWALDLTNTVDSLCKLRAFVLFSSRNIASWLILLAAMDRWFLSCHDAHHRQHSTIKNAYRGIVVTIISSIFLYGSVLYCYEANLINTPLKCYGKTSTCRLINDLSYACITILAPMLLMIMFGLMTIVNINKIKNTVHATNPLGMKHVQNSSVVVDQAGASKRKLDYRLFLMLCIQITLLSLCTFPQAVQKLYSTLTTDSNQTPLNKAIQNFVFNLFLLMTYFANGMPFYIYTLSGGKIFRQTFKQLIDKLRHRVL